MACCLQCGCVDHGSVCVQPTETELFVLLDIAVLTALCKALSGTLFIVLHGQTQRMFFFSVSLLIKGLCK